MKKGKKYNQQLPNCETTKRKRKSKKKRRKRKEKKWKNDDRELKHNWEHQAHILNKRRQFQAPKAEKKSEKREKKRGKKK